MIGGATARFIILVLAVLVGVFVQTNPLLFGRTVEISKEDEKDMASSFFIYTEHAVLDQHLQVFQEQLGNDYEAYRNHCLRVLTFAVYHLGQETFPTTKDINVIALALAYHDLGLWVSVGKEGKNDKGALDYLDPSVALLEQQVALASSDESEPSTTWTSAQIATAREIILQHHKLTTWEPDTANKSLLTKNAILLVNVVRQADWADATYGVIRFDLPVSHLQKAYEVIPEKGFHAMLAGFGKRLSPDSLLGQLQVLRIFRL